MHDFGVKKLSNKLHDPSYRESGTKAGQIWKYSADYLLLKKISVLMFKLKNKQMHNHDDHLFL